MTFECKDPASLPDPTDSSNDLFSSKTPSVTIGIPVLNGGETIHRAINSAIGQTFSQFELVISDNGSTDDTRSICEMFQQSDPRIRLMHHPATRSAFENFRFLIENSQSQYFVFLAADDYWHPAFLETAIKHLEENPWAVAAGPRTIFKTLGTPKANSNGTFNLRGATLNRLKEYFRNPGDNSRFYFLFKTHPLKLAFRSTTEFHAADWHIMAITLLYGEHIEIPGDCNYRTYESSEKYTKQLLDQKNIFFSALMPLLPLIHHIKKSIKTITFLKLLPTLSALNLKKSKETISFIAQSKLKKYSK